jgi:hypothetical protein
MPGSSEVLGSTEKSSTAEVLKSICAIVSTELLYSTAVPSSLEVLSSS